MQNLRSESQQVLDSNPGLHPSRLAALMHTAVERCQLDLSEKVVLNEAATGAYVVTTILAGLAGASHVYRIPGPSRYGSVEDVTAQTLQLADLVGVRDRIEIITDKSRDIVSQADVITNSGFVRPLDATTVDWMKPTAVIP